MVNSPIKWDKVATKYTNLAHAKGVFQIHPPLFLVLSVNVRETEHYTTFVILFELLNFRIDPLTIL